MFRSTALAASLLLALASSAAGAESAPRRHDGFYLRIGAGPGWTIGSAESNGLTSDLSGFGAAGEIAAGWSLAPGFVVGFGQYGVHTFGPTYSPSEGGDFDGGALAMAGLGPFIDYYIDPAKGLHVQAAALFATAVAFEEGDIEGASGFGFGGMLGGGWEMWFADEWSVGGLLRVAYYRPTVQGDDTRIDSTYGVFVPALLVATTFH